MPYNAHPDDPVTILRLMSNLEGLSGFVSVLPDTEEETAFLDAMKAKYYKLYFKMKREEAQREKNNKDETENSSQ